MMVVNVNQEWYIYNEITRDQSKRQDEIWERIWFLLEELIFFKIEINNARNKEII